MHHSEAAGLTETANVFVAAAGLDIAVPVRASAVLVAEVGPFVVRTVRTCTLQRSINANQILQDIYLSYM